MQHVFRLPTCTYTYVLRECEWRTKLEWKEYILKQEYLLSFTLPWCYIFFFQVSSHLKEKNEKISLEFKLVQ